ncbi:hypothetical protein ACXR0O_24600 [Verrucomicrobiota bacterium sgz303538]
MSSIATGRARTADTFIIVRWFTALADRSGYTAGAGSIAGTGLVFFSVGRSAAVNYSARETTECMDHRF